MSKPLDNPTAAALNHATVAEQQGRVDDAVAAFRSVLAHDPSHPGALLRVAQAALKAGDREAALAQLRRASVAARVRGLAAQALPIHTELIVALRSGDASSRLDAVRNAIADCGEIPGLIWEECECLRALDMRQDRLMRLNRLAALQPKDPVILAELGRALLGSNSAAQAVIPLRAAYDLGARSTSLLVSLANAEITGGSLSRAQTLLDEALTQDPNDFAALALRCNVAQRSCDFDAVRIFEPKFVERAQSLAVSGAIDSRVAPFLLLACDIDATTVRDYSARYYAERIAQTLSPLVREALTPTINGRRLRVGYFTGDFHGHAVSILTAGMFEQADRNRFENFALSHGPRVGNEYQLRLKAAFEHWIELNDMSDEAAAEAIARLNLDVLVDLKGCTNGSRPRILARRPAPIQLHFLAYPSSMGLPGVDYYVGDSVTIPSAHEYEFSERVIRLPGCFFPNDDRREHPSPTPRSALGLPEHAFVLCSFNQTWKLRERYVRAWFSALSRHRHAVLWLGDPGMDHPSRQNLLALASEYEVADQVVWASYSSTLSEHLARLAQADLAVDQSPYNSHTTAADALWMGVPVLTCKGDRFDSRVAASLLEAVGAHDCIALDFAAYETKLDQVLADAANGASPRERNTERYLKSALFDTPRFTRDWEVMLRELVTRQETAREG